MSYKIVILEEAKADYKESLLFYKNINPKLAVRFNDSFKKSIAFITKNPFQFQIKYDDVRIIFFRTFPYAIQYSIYENSVIIKSIFHTSRDSDLNVF
ncbi:type II toxin-antitoxin system RelE/ParE family toxin [Flavobacterium sharifuzzamanii]|uniref:type II toxin-antitoxin system RelE/ParE family toxin n=1 Tax=Flavobacterium sharifuzzamanii TaxID=2211133 RepID=UPI000DAB9DD3|nr:type II toxin-antitoxin system RelE/ParE family toxin [Flavobacterium sharifuzzamanii]KAF2079241.1 type II toxin-antitoxin system RelE/ParE family toxin [Flavobacterium sharifuzzamanii]